MSINPCLHNLALPEANKIYTQKIEKNIRRVRFQSRSAVDVRFAFDPSFKFKAVRIDYATVEEFQHARKVDGSELFYTLKSGREFVLDFDPRQPTNRLSLHFASPSKNTVIEIICETRIE